MPPNIRAIPRSERLPQAEHSSNRLLVTDSQSTHQTALWQGHNLHICSVFNALIVTPLIVPEQTWASSAGYALSELGGNGNGCGRKPCRATVYFKIVGL